MRATTIGSTAAAVNVPGDTTGFRGETHSGPALGQATVGPHQELLTRINYATGHLHNPYPDLPGPVFAHNDRFTFVAIPASSSTSRDALNAVAYLYAAQVLLHFDQTQAGKAAAESAAALEHHPDIIRVFTDALNSSGHAG